MKHHMNKTIVAAAVAAALGLGAGAAQAKTLYYQAFGGWNGNHVGGTSVVFEDDTETTGDGSPDPTFDVGANMDPFDPTDLRRADLHWGTAQTDLGPYAGKSGLALSGFPLGIADGNEGTTFAAIDVDSASFVRADFGMLTHFNRIIDDDPPPAPTSADVSWRLRILEDTNDDGTPDAVVFDGGYQPFRLRIWETNNDPTTHTDDICPNSNDAGTIVSDGSVNFTANGEQESNNPCDDAFQYEPLTAQERVTFSTTDGDFELELIEGFFPEGNGDEPQATFWSSENATNQAVVRFQIRKVEKPEVIPTLSEWAMGLMGLLLAGFAWMGFRRRNKDELAV